MLKTTEISIPFTKGVDTKVDEKLSMSPTEIINAKIGKEGILKKVSGVTYETKNVSGGLLDSAKNVSSFNNSELVLNRFGLYAKEEGTSEWSLTSRQNSNQISSDFLDVNSSTTHSYVEDDTYSIYGTGTEARVKVRASQRSISGFIGNLLTDQIVAVENGLEIGYLKLNAGQISWVLVSGGVQQPEVALGSYTNAGIISTKSFSDGLYILYMDTNVKCVKIDSSGSIVYSEVMATTTTGTEHLNLDIFSNEVYITYNNDSDSLIYYEKRSLDLSTVIDSYIIGNFEPSFAALYSGLIYTLAEGSIGVTMIVTGFNTTRFEFFTAVLVLGVGSFIRVRYFAQGQLFNRNIIAGKGFTDGTRAMAIIQAYSTIGDYKIFIIDEFLNITTTVLNSNSSPLHFPLFFSEIKNYNGSFRFTSPEQDRGQILCDVNFDNPRIKSVNYTNIKLYGGGTPFVFDGQSTFPASFSLEPSIISFAINGSGTLTGTYDYKAIFTIKDNKGNLYESSDSEKKQVILSGANNVAFTINAPIEAYNNEVYSGVEFYVQLYKKESGDTVYKFVSETKVLKDSLGIIRMATVSDIGEDISSNKSLYVTDDTTTTMRNETLPPLKDLTWSNGRIFGLSSLDNSLVYSRKYIAGEGISFPLEFNLYVEDNQTLEAQEVEAIAAMDSKLIIMKESSVLALYGEGPDNNGDNSDFTEPEIISTDAGCINPLSTVLTGAGLFFQSSKGIYMMARNLVLSYKGKEVEKLTYNSVVSALNMSTNDEVVFHTKDGVEITYNYFYDGWTWADYKKDIISASSINGKLMTVDSSGQVLIENSQYRDGLDFIEQSFNTGWLKLKGIQNFQRIKKLIFKGEYKDDHQLKVEVFYDYQDTSPDEYIITPEIGVDYQFSVHLKRQKCQSIRVKITCMDTGATEEGFSLSDMTIVAGLRKGINKLPSERQY